MVGPFNTAGSTVGGGVCLGNRRVTDPKRYSGVRWSPDGRRFAFWRQTAESPTGGRADVFVADADGRNERNLTRSTSEFNWSPDWSPTGDRIVYNAAGPDVTQLVTMRADGSDKRPLDATTLPRSGFAALPSWSSADLIVYTRSDSSSGIWSLWAVRLMARGTACS